MIYGQGDTIHKAFKVTKGGVVVPREEIGEIVVQINDDRGTNEIELLLSRDEINYDDEGQFFYFDLSEEQTFSLEEDNVYNIRAMGVDGDIKSTLIKPFPLRKAINHRKISEQESSEGGNNEQL